MSTQRSDPPLRITKVRLCELDEPLHRGLTLLLHCALRDVVRREEYGAQVLLHLGIVSKPCSRQPRCSVDGSAIAWARGVAAGRLLYPSAH